MSFFNSVSTISNPGETIPKQSMFRYHYMEIEKKKFFQNFVVNQPFMVFCNVIINQEKAENVFASVF